MDNFYVGSDHGGYHLKELMKDYLDEMGINYTDIGAFSAEKSVDYPDIAREVCEKVYENKCMGLLICGTGIGMSIIANRRRGIRAALCLNETMAEYSKKHNNANILCMGERIIGSEVAKRILKTFIETKFEGGRHDRRLEKIEEFGSEDLK